MKVSSRKIQEGRCVSVKDICYVAGKSSTVLMLSKMQHLKSLFVFNMINTLQVYFPNVYMTIQVLPKIPQI